MDRRPVTDFRPSYLMFADEVAQAVSGVIASGRVLQGDYVERCEAALAELTGKRYALLFSNGTTAIEALMAQDEGPVGTPTVNFVSVPYVARRLGREVVLRPRTRPLSGPMAEAADPLPAGTQRWHVALAGQAGADYVGSVGPEDIEDASQCFLTRTPKGMVGTLGRAGVYSFTFNKALTAGEGGCVVTDDAGLQEKLRRYRDFGRLDRRAVPAERPIDHLGYNHRLSELHAAMLEVQLRHADEISAHMAGLHTAYRDQLRRVGLELVTDDYDNHTRAVLRVGDVPGVRQRLRTGFGIATPTPIMDFSMAEADWLDGRAEPGWDRLLCLPFWYGLGEEDLAYVADSLAIVLQASENATGAGT